jgi:ABC-2 type transport system permease protein
MIQLDKRMGTTVQQAPTTPIANVPLCCPTLTFWTTETLEIMSALTFGGIETSKYPLSIYRAWFRKFFTMVVPMGSATYFHVAILERTDPLGTSVNFQLFVPISGLIFFILTLQLWQIGVRHYQSTGS